MFAPPVINAFTWTDGEGYAFERFSDWMQPVINKF